MFLWFDFYLDSFTAFLLACAILSVPLLFIERLIIWFVPAFSTLFARLKEWSLLVYILFHVVLMMVNVYIVFKWLQ